MEENEEKSFTCKGYYIFIFNLRKNKKIKIGKLGHMSFMEGYYLYLGSSFLKGGILQRILWHLRKEKKKHWHIDYLTTLEELEPIEIFYICYNDKGKEPLIAECLNEKGFLVIERFGSSDVKSKGHLFFLGKTNIDSEKRLKITDCLRTLFKKA
ncbi:MAG: GIY-YIG nuclease family protein [Fervidicoccaceae archaeon]